MTPLATCAARAATSLGRQLLDFFVYLVVIVGVELALSGWLSLLPSR
jgi:type III secretory pathway component EscS